MPKIDPQTVQCKFCGRQTMFVQSHECNECFRSRMRKAYGVEADETKPEEKRTDDCTKDYECASNLVSDRTPQPRTVFVMASNHKDSGGAHAVLGLPEF